MTLSDKFYKEAFKNPTLKSTAMRRLFMLAKQQARTNVSVFRGIGVTDTTLYAIRDGKENVSSAIVLNLMGYLSIYDPLLVDIGISDEKAVEMMADALDPVQQ